MKISYQESHSISDYKLILEGLVYDLGTMFYHTILWWCCIIDYPRAKGKFNRIWVICNEKNKLNPIGIGIIGLYSLESTTKILWIGWLGVISKYRGKGIGANAVKFLHSYAKRMNAEVVMVYVDRKDKRVHKFYEALGYTRYCSVWEYIEKRPHLRLGDEFESGTDIIYQKQL